MGKVKIFSGAVQPTSGRLLVDGREVRFHGPADAIRAGMTLLNVPIYGQHIVRGLIILLAVLVNQLQRTSSTT